MVGASRQGPYIPVSTHYAALEARLAELAASVEAQDHGAAFGHVSPGRSAAVSLRGMRRDSQVYYPVAPEVHRDVAWDEVPGIDSFEYTHARYSPILTEDPRDFERDGYSLRFGNGGLRAAGEGATAFFGSVQGLAASVPAFGGGYTSRFPPQAVPSGRGDWVLGTTAAGGVVEREPFPGPHELPMSAKVRLDEPAAVEAAAEDAEAQGGAAGGPPAKAAAQGASAPSQPLSPKAPGSSADATKDEIREGLRTGGRESSVAPLPPLPFGSGLGAGKAAPSAPPMPGARAPLAQPHRPDIRLLICVTLYNEDETTLSKTLLGICENLEVLYARYAAHGDERGLDWRQVAVAIVQDGRDKADASVLASATVAGYYSSNLVRDEVLGLPVAMHLFEYTTRFKKHAGLDCYPPLQIMYASKAENKGKLDSHCWYFDAFARHLQPEFCVLFDAGTRPLPNALKSLYAHFRRYPDCGGATGDLSVERPYRNFITSVQFMEWKVAHFLSKPVESVCGYLTVLPGAFSAFRWEAIEGEPLRRYFYGLYSQADLTAFEANMYLAEDRILCLEIVARKDARFYLEYVKEAQAEADPVTSLAGLIKQRRRWLNGTFFAMVYALANWGRIWRESRHTIARKFALSFEFVYLSLMTVVGTWFGIGVVYTMIQQLFLYVLDENEGLVQLGKYLTLIYFILLVVELIANLKCKPEAMAQLHLFCAVVFIAYMCGFTAILVWYMSKYSLGEIVGNVSQFGVLFSIGTMVLAAGVHGEGTALLGAGVQYWLMQPIFYNVLQMNAFCNTDDITWGTKNLDTKRDAARAKGILGSGAALRAARQRILRRARQERKRARLAAAAAAEEHAGPEGARADNAAVSSALVQACTSQASLPLSQSSAGDVEPRESRETRAFWSAMARVHERLTDSRLRSAHASIKEQKLKAFATYLLIAWVASNVVFAAVVNTLSDLSWEHCTASTAATYGVLLADAAQGDSRAAAALGRVVSAASAILTDGSDNYPFGGLDNFPSAYPVLLAGSAQSNASQGDDVTVLAPSRDVFSALPDALPNFTVWINASTGVDATNATEELDYLGVDSSSISDTSEGYTCTTRQGRQYYLTVQFVLLATLVGTQTLASIVYMVQYYVRRWRRRRAAKRTQRVLRQARDGSIPRGAPPSDDGSDRDGDGVEAGGYAEERERLTPRDLSSSHDPDAYASARWGEGGSTKRSAGWTPNDAYEAYGSEYAFSARHAGLGSARGAGGTYGVAAPGSRLNPAGDVALASSRTGLATSRGSARLPGSAEAPQEDQAAQRKAGQGKPPKNPFSKLLRRH